MITLAMSRCGSILWAFIVLFAILWGHGAHAQPAATLFDLGAGVRPLGMGGAFVALADDEQAALYNPAGLAYLAGVRISSTYERRFGASNYLDAVGGAPRFGGGLFLFSFGAVEGRNEQDQVTGSLGYLQLGLAAAGGVALRDLPLGFTRGLGNVAVGGQLKLLGISTVEGGSGIGAALAWGALLRADRPLSLPIEELRLGTTLENLPGFGTPWPLRWALGLAVRPITEISVALDVALPFEFHLGSEVRVPLRAGPAIAVRAGLFTRGGVFGFTAGLGLGIGAFRFDYAFVSHPQLPGSHRLALAWRF